MARSCAMSRMRSKVACSPHQGCILPPVGGRGRDIHQLEHPALAVLAQFAPDRDRVYRRTLQQQRTGRLIDLPVSGVAQVRGIDSGQNVRHLRLIDEHGADHGILGGEPAPRRGWSLLPSVHLPAMPVCGDAAGGELVRIVPPCTVEERPGVGDAHAPSPMSPWP